MNDKRRTSFIVVSYVDSKAILKEVRSGSE